MALDLKTAPAIDVDDITDATMLAAFTGDTLQQLPAEAMRGLQSTGVDQLTGGSRVLAFGCSFPAGAGATGSTDHVTVAGQNVPANAYVARARRALKLPVVNYAYGGAEVMDQAPVMFAHPPLPGDFVLYDLGPNGAKTKKSAGQLRVELEANLACLTWLTRQSALILGSASMTTGSTEATNTAPPYYDIWDFAVRLKAVGATATFKVFGSAVVVATNTASAEYTNGGAYQITIDGVQTAPGQYPVDAGVSITTAQGHGVAPKGQLFGGLMEKEHTVTVTCTSGTVEIGFVAGFSPFTQIGSPQVFVVNTPRQTNYAANPAGGVAPYTTMFASDASVAAMNAVIGRAVKLLAGYGAKVALIDVASAITAAMITDDGIHPGDLGHDVYYEALLAMISGLATARERQAAFALTTWLNLLADGVGLTGLLRLLDGIGVAFDPGGFFKLLHRDGAPIAGMREAYSTALLAMIYPGAGSGFAVVEDNGDDTVTSHVELARGGIVSMKAGGKVTIGTATLLRGQQSALPAAATDLASALTLLNAIRTGVTADSATHGLFAAS